MNLESSDILFSAITYDSGKGFIPLTNLDIQVLVVDTSTRVTLSQTYTYDDSTIARDAFYLFPVPPGAIVCGFEVRTNDDVHMEGVVKEIDEASRDYRRILGDNDIADVVQRSCRDILVLSLGSFLPRRAVTISTTYAMDLFDSNEATIKFRIPSYVGRFLPKSVTLPQSATRLATLNIDLDIEMPGEVLYVHSNFPFQDIPVPSIEKLGSTIARKRATSTDIHLDTDILVSIQALNLDQSRCFVEQWQDTAALSLTAVPSVISGSHDSDNCEYIFLIDRSWSMCVDDKMEKIKLAMGLLLKTLPVENTWFNVYSFEHSWLSIWTESQPFHQVTLKEALNFLSHLDPRGGTELFPVFQAALTSRRTNATTKIFMVTDGEIHYPQRTIDLVTNAVNNADPAYPVKVFTLAIGSSASDILCEGLAIVGSGFCLRTLDSENPLQKCTTVLNKMMLSDIHALKVNWSVGGIVYQAPIDLSRCPKGCLSVKAIIPRSNIPKSVSLLGKTSNGTPIHLEIPTRVPRILPPFSPRKKPFFRPLYHTIAANNLSQDLEQSQTSLLPLSDWDLQLTPSSRSARIKQELLRLGIQYNIINSLATFVIVEKSEEQDLDSVRFAAASPLTPTTDSRKQATPVDPAESIDRPSSPDSNGITDSSQSSLDEESRPSTPFTSPGLPDIPKTFPRSLSNRKPFILQAESVPDDEPDETYIFPSVPPTHFVAPPLQYEKIVFSYSNPIRMLVHRSACNQEEDARALDWLDGIQNDTNFSEKLAELIELQWYDGSFPDLRRLSYVIGCPYHDDDDIPLYLTGVVIPSSVDYEHVWGTALAIKFLRKKYPHNWCIWKDLARKSMTWGGRACGGLANFERIIAFVPLIL